MKEIGKVVGCCLLAIFLLIIGLCIHHEYGVNFKRQHDRKLFIERQNLFYHYADSVIYFNNLRIDAISGMLRNMENNDSFRYFSDVSACFDVPITRYSHLMDSVNRIPIRAPNP